MIRIRWTSTINVTLLKNYQTKPDSQRTSDGLGGKTAEIIPSALGCSSTAICHQMSKYPPVSASKRRQSCLTEVRDKRLSFTASNFWGLQAVGQVPSLQEHNPTISRDASKLSRFLRRLFICGVLPPCDVSRTSETVLK